jgi:hypothetical protein
MKQKLSRQDRGFLKRREGVLERRRAFIRQIEGYEEYKVIELVVQNNATADVAVQRIKEMTMAALAAHGPTARDGVGLVDYNVSLSVVELAQRLEPGQHGTLVEFMSKLQKETAMDPATGEPLEFDKDILWTGLPSFGYTQLEGWCEYGGDHQGMIKISCGFTQLTGKF